MALLCPQPISHSQLNPAFLLDGVQLALERAKAGCKLLLVRAEVECLGHLFGGVSTGPGVGHRQAGRNAVGRKEKVAAAVFELRIEVEGKAVIAPDAFVDLIRLSWV